MDAVQFTSDIQVPRKINTCLALNPSDSGFSPSVCDIILKLDLSTLSVITVNHSINVIISSISYDKIVLIMLIAEMWEHSDIAKQSLSDEETRVVRQSDRLATNQQFILII